MTCLACAAIACGGDDSTPGAQPEGGSPGQDGASQTSDGAADVSSVPPAPDAASTNDSAGGGPPDAATTGDASGGPPPDAGSTGDSSSGPPTDAASGGEASVDAGAYNCAAPPSDYASCATSSDCAIVAKGCYCGQQLEYGVANKYMRSAAPCETTAANHCALGCANFPGHAAQDGRSDLDGGTISVRCVAVDGGALECQTFVQ